MLKEKILTGNQTKIKLTVNYEYPAQKIDRSGVNDYFKNNYNLIFLSEIFLS